MKSLKFALILFLVASCGEQSKHTVEVNPREIFEQIPKDTTKIDFDSTLRFALYKNPESLNPFFTTTNEASIVSGLIYDSLFYITKSMELIENKNLVKSVKWSKDGRTCEITLNNGLKWHDNKPFTAKDVVFSYNLLFDKRIPVRILRAEYENPSGIYATSNNLIKIEFKEENPINKWALLFPVIPEHIWGPIRKYDPSLKRSKAAREAEVAAVGNGPYKLLLYKPNEEIVLKRWDKYPGQKPCFKKIIFKIIPDKNAALLAFKAGKVDALRFFNPKEIGKLKSLSSFFGKYNIAAGSTWSYQFIVWNTSGRNPFFIDKNIRIALAMTIDIDKIINDIFDGYFERCIGPFHPSYWAFSKKVTPINYNLIEADRLFNESGWKRGQDGWRYKECFYKIKNNKTIWYLNEKKFKKKVKFSFNILVPAGASGTLNSAVIWKNTLSKLGIDMKIISLEKSAFRERVFTHSFDACFMGWSPGVDPYTLEDNFGSTGWPDGNNFGGYKNEILDNLFEKGKKENNFAVRKEIYRKIHEIIYKDQPWCFLWFLSDFIVLKEKIKGISFGPRGAFGFYPGILGWWKER